MVESRRVYLKNGVSLFDFKSFDDILAFIDQKPGVLVAMNAGKIGRSSPEMIDIINHNIGYADGIAAVTALKKHGIKDSIKIPGCELWLKIIERKCKDSSFYFVGGQQEVIENVINKLKKCYPGINILGYRNGYLKGDDEEILIEDIALKKPDVVFVAMGSPKQELLMKRMMMRHSALYQGLGGSFDVYVGRMKRAPKWWIKHNVEGVYRVLTDQKKWGRFVRDIWVLFKIKLGFI